VKFDLGRSEFGIDWVNGARWSFWEQHLIPPFDAEESPFDQQLGFKRQPICDLPKLMPLGFDRAFKQLTCELDKKVLLFKNWNFQCDGFSKCL